MLKGLAIDFRHPLFFGAAGGQQVGRAASVVLDHPLSLRIQLTRDVSLTRASPTARCICLDAIGFICYEFIA